MKDNTAKTSKNGVHTTNTASSHELTSNNTFSWMKALPIIIAVAIVGILIVLSTFAGTKGEAYVSNIYPGLLGRSASSADIKYWGKKIDSGKSSETAVFTVIYNSSEAKAYRAKLIAKQNAKAKTSTTSNTKAAPTSSWGKNGETTNLATETAWVNGQYTALGLKPGSQAIVKARAAQITSKKKTRPQVTADLRAAKTASAKVAAAKPAPGCSRESLKKQFVTDPNGYYHYFSSLDDAVHDYVYELYQKYVAYDGTNADIDNRDKDKQVDAILECKKTASQLKKELDASIGKAFNVARDKRRAAYAEFNKPMWDFLIANYSIRPGQVQDYCWQNIADWKAGKLNKWSNAPIICLKNSGWTVKALQDVGFKLEGYLKQALEGDPAGAAAAYIADIQAVKGAPSGTRCSDLDEAVAAKLPSCADGAEYASAEDLSTASNPRPRAATPSTGNTGTTTTTTTTASEPNPTGAPSGSNQVNY